MNEMENEKFFKDHLMHLILRVLGGFCLQAFLFLDAGTSTHQTDHSPNSESSHCKGIKMVHLDAPWQSHS